MAKSRHAAYVAQLDDDSDLDALAANFVPNVEASAVVMVPVASLDGTSNVVAGPTQLVRLRDKLGYKRVQFLKGLPTTAAEAIKRTQRSVRFKRPVDGDAAMAAVGEQRAAYAGQVARVRNQVWQRDRAVHGLNLFGGRRRPGDMQSLAEADGGTCLTQDKKVEGVGDEDLNTAAGLDAFGARMRATPADWMHASWDCFSWSPAHCTCMPHWDPDGISCVGSLFW